MRDRDAEPCRQSDDGLHVGVAARGGVCLPPAIATDATARKRDDEEREKMNLRNMGVPPFQDVPGRRFRPGRRGGAFIIDSGGAPRSMLLRVRHGPEMYIIESTVKMNACMNETNRPAP